MKSYSIFFLQRNGTYFLNKLRTSASVHFRNTILCEKLTVAYLVDKISAFVERACLSNNTNLPETYKTKIKCHVAK